MKRLMPALLAVVVLTGCATGGGVRHIPVTRDYGELERVDLDTAADAVHQAHRLGAPHYAPYEYFAAVKFLDKARDSRGKVKWDYSRLAVDYAKRAMRKTATPEDRPAYTPPDNYEAAVNEFNRLKARYLELDQAKAKEVAPFVYAHLGTELSFAENTLASKRNWRKGAEHLGSVEADLVTIISQDSDDDGIPDMVDGAPFEPEDFDDFEAEDGIPDPDNDGDGILDVNDVMPNEPETFNRWRDHDGAPDEYPDLKTIYFSQGSTAFTSETKGYLQAITQLIESEPEIKLHIKGHTDDAHSHRYSLELSRRRAQAIRNYLVSIGAPEDRIVVSFYAETQPASDNSTAAGRAENRRVELDFE